MKPRCIRASGVSPPSTISSQPASAAEIKLIAQPANIAATASAPARRRVGSQPIAQRPTTIATVAGCAISLIAAALAGWLLIVLGGETPEARMQRGFLAMVVRLAVVVALGVAAALSGELARQPLLFWIGTAYVALLPLEVKLAIL